MGIINRKELDDKAEGFWHANKVGMAIGAGVIIGLFVLVWWLF